MAKLFHPPDPLLPQSRRSTSTHRRLRLMSWAFLLTFGFVLLAETFARTEQSPTTPFSLTDLFAPGVMLQDRNGDGVIDSIDARIRVAKAPTDAEVVAAANIAARLGFESSAMDLPFDAARGTVNVEILVGSRAAAQQPGPEPLSLASLRPGEGLIAAMETTAGQRSVVVAGGNDAGMLAAAETLAGRLPHLAQADAPTLADVAEEAARFLTSNGVAVESTSVPAIHVMAGTPDLERVVLLVDAKSAAEARKARSVLRSIVRTRVASGTGPLPDTQLQLSYTHVRELRVRLAAPGTKPIDVDIPRREQPRAAALPALPRPGPKHELDLSSLYTNDGLLGDSDDNVIPDRVDAILSPVGEGTEGTIDLAARIGLESTGISIPIARLPETIDKPEAGPTLVLIGVSHPLVQRLIEEKKFERPALQPGEGVIQVVRRAFGERSAVVVTGGDANGVAGALRQLTERFPHLWARGKDRTTLGDVEEDVRRFLSARTPAGQAATALYKLDALAKELAGKDLASARVTVSLEKPPEGFAEFVRREASQKIKADTLNVTIDNRDVQKAKHIFSDEFEIPSEVDEFWQVFRAKVVPAVKRGQGVVVEARLSEPPEMRRQIETEALAELVKAGAAKQNTSVTVLSAYKQGFSWLHDAVRPALIGKSLGQITIRFAEIGPPPEWPQQSLYISTRWLLELFPIDEVLARELGVGLKSIRFEKMPIGSPAYEVIATDKVGNIILQQTFEPKFVLRSLFDQVPNYEKVRVTTGWMEATIAGQTLVDQRIVTDLERYWDRYQAKTLQALYEYALRVTNGKPRADDAPLFGELRVDLSLSEPNYPLGVDQEQIAPMEALHEDTYFSTLHFIELMGMYIRGPATSLSWMVRDRHDRATQGKPFNYPGRVIPIMRPKGDGKAGHAKITLSGFVSSRPAVIVEYQERNGRRGVARLDIPKVELDRPAALSVRLRDGQDSLSQLDLWVKIDSEKDERAEWIKRTRTEQVDWEHISAEQVRSLLNTLARMRAAGLYRDALAFHNVGLLSMTTAWEYNDDPTTRLVASLAPNGAPAPFPNINALLPPGYRHTGEPLVQWDTPMPPPETYEVLAKMSTFDEAAVYKVGESYLGTDIWAMDLMPPIETSHWSQAKATALKPTVVYSARQDANEVSSTSHVLKLAELLLTDREFKQKLQKVNVVIHPITNPDGAQLAYDLYKITPNFMLHAGYLGPLGVTVSGDWYPDTIYPESQVRPKIWSTWLPDIFLNPHGMPHHEWVQLFTEYAPWVRSRVADTRDLCCMPRGWWMPGFNYIDDPRYPRHKAAVFKIREMIARYINAATEVRALNERMYDRYRRYGFEWNTEDFKMHFTDDVLLYTAIRGQKANPSAAGERFMARNPNVTIWEGQTEAPDETAEGDWMKLVAGAGLEWDKAILQYLVDGNHTVERTGEMFADGFRLKIHRPRPPKADGKKHTSTQN